MEGREKNAETQAVCHRHVLQRILAAASPKRKCDRLFKVTSPAAHTHLTRARCHGLLARSAATNICSMVAVLAHCSLFRPSSRSGIVVNDNDEYTTSSLSLPPKPDHCEASRVLVPEDRFHRRNSRYAVNRYSRTAIALVTCLEGSAVAQQIESPPEEMSDEIGVTMRALMRLLQPG